MDALRSIATKMALEQKAVELATRFGGPPADMDAIAGAVGIHDIAVGDIDAAAILRAGPVEGTWGVVLRKIDPFTRRRFSLAHEVAHLALGIIGDERQYLGEVAARRRRSPDEKSCDFFAACLLMPQPWVVARVKDCPPERLAPVFDVSTEAMRIRLEQLGFNAIAARLE